MNPPRLSRSSQVAWRGGREMTPHDALTPTPIFLSIFFFMRDLQQKGVIASSSVMRTNK